MPRVDVAGLVYHAYNRGNAGGTIFVTQKDYAAFEDIITAAKERTGMRILAYCLMPNHWHFVLHPQEDGLLAKFFQWATLTHTQRWQVVRGQVGSGHIYQGPYKANVCEQEDAHFLRLVRYVERNALRAQMVTRAESWRWCSAWRRVYGSDEHKRLLASWPVPEPADYLEYLNAPHSEEELAVIRTSIRRGRPYGRDPWVEQVVEEYALEATVRSKGGQTRHEGTRYLR